MNTVPITADKMAFGGDCIGKINGKTVFIPFAIPGERLEINIIQSYRDYDTAKIVTVLEPSMHRIKPPCPLYGICGGCNMMHIESKFQTELRKNILSDCFLRNGISVKEISVLSGQAFSYRNRFLFHDGGLKAAASNTTVPLSSCPVADKNIDEWLRTIPYSERPKGKCRVFGSDRLITEGDVTKLIIIEENEDECASNRHADKIRVRSAKTIISPQNAANINVCGKKIAFDVRGFFQSNIVLLEKTIPEVCRNLTGQTALDLYAGCGTFSVFLADIFSHITLVECNRNALVFTEQNLTGMNHMSFGLSGAQWARINNGKKYDAVVIDPPRSGIEKEVVQYLCNTKIPDLRYLSCNPSTLARDAATLINAGYTLEKLTMLDFYPNTGHIEALAILKYLQ